MKHLKLNPLRLALATAVLVTGGSTMLLAQAEHHDWNHDGDGYRRIAYQDRDRDWDRNRDRDRDRDRDDDRDRDRNRRRRDRDDDDRYRNGRNGNYYPNHGYPNNGRGYYGSARQYGYQDGLNDGRNDGQSGHSFRPTHDNNYKHADRGYNGSFGDKNQYKQVYRQGYEQGYQQGYNYGGYGRRRY
ncbi:MAG TPA: hypothetical protein VNV88_07995 [Candidatus Solibacter sp.]|jgi:hypothetical protein|nr:hypothetical protein [Candidatus Solibacter sp.]